MVILTGVPTDEDLRPARGDFARQRADRAGVDLADLRRLLRLIVLEARLQPFEGRLDLDLAAISEDGGRPAFEGRIEVAQSQRAPGGPYDLVGLGVKPEELILPVPLGHIAAAEKTACVLSHEQWQVRLFLHKAPVVETGIDDYFVHREYKRHVGADADGDMVVRVHGRRAKIWGDGDDFAAVVSGLGKVVVPLHVGIYKVF